MNSNKLIKRIIFCIDKDDFNDDILDITIKTEHQSLLYQDMKLNKINTTNNINVYENSCIISWDGKTVIVTLTTKSFNNLLKGVGEIYIINDDIDYNHVNDILNNNNLYLPKPYEESYSVYTNFYKKSALSLFVDPLKYPELVSFVIHEFLKNNDYPQDLKNIILLLYINV